MFPIHHPLGLPRWLSGKEFTCQGWRSNLGLIPESGRSSGEGNGNPLKYSSLENPMDRGVMGLHRVRHD